MAKTTSNDSSTHLHELELLRTEYYNDRRWLFRFFFFFLGILVFVISVLYGLTTDQIGTEIKKSMASTAMKQASDSAEALLSQMEQHAKLSTDIIKILATRSSFHLTSGSTDPENTPWQKYERDPNTLWLQVNTTEAKFTTTPIYLTTLGGTSSHFLTTGISSIYDPQPSGFKIYLKFNGQVKDLLLEARNSKWHVQWVALTPSTDSRK